MRRWLPLVAAAGLAAAALLVLVSVLQPAPPATRQDQARALAAELRCPDCESLSVAESRTAAAAAIRAEIDQQLAAGRSPADIRASFVARYGEWILLQPSSPLVWLLPIAALLAGVALFGWWLIGREPRPGPADRGETVGPIRKAAAGDLANVAGGSQAERQRVRDEAAQLDG